MPTDGHPPAGNASIADGPDRSFEKRRFRINLVIFLSVNAALAVSWLGLILTGIDVHTTLWPWAVVVVLWGARLAVEGRAAYRRSASRDEGFSEEQIQRELNRMG